MIYFAILMTSNGIHELAPLKHIFSELTLNDLKIVSSFVMSCKHMQILTSFSGQWEMNIPV